MASRGDVQEEVFFATGTTVVSANVPDLPEGLKECCYELFLFTYPTDVLDELKNDRTSYFKYWPTSFETGTLTIQKCVGGVFTDQEIITDDTYGTFKDFAEETKNGQVYISIKNIDWTAIRVAYGVGEYRIEAAAMDIFGNIDVDYSFSYKVKDYTPDLANNSVFIEITNSGLLGNINNPRERFAFPDDWQDAIRIKGKFGDDFSEYEDEYTRLNDGFEDYTRHVQVPKYILFMDRAPQNVRNFMRNEIMMANTIEMTDYNADNANCHIKTPVRRSGGFTPEYINRVTKAKTEIEFRSSYDNTYKKQC
jgi:hypothetical protein